MFAFRRTVAHRRFPRVVAPILVERFLQPSQFQDQRLALWPVCAAGVRIGLDGVAAQFWFDRPHGGTLLVARTRLSAFAVFGLSGVGGLRGVGAAAWRATRAKTSSRGPNAITRPS